MTFSTLWHLLLVTCNMWHQTDPSNSNSKVSNYRSLASANSRGRSLTPNHTQNSSSPHDFLLQTHGPHPIIVERIIQRSLLNWALIIYSMIYHPQNMSLNFNHIIVSTIAYDFTEPVLDRWQKQLPIALSWARPHTIITHPSFTTISLSKARGLTG